MKTPAAVVEKMTSRYGTIEAARVKYAELAPKASLLRGVYVTCHRDGSLSLESAAAFVGPEADGMYFFSTSIL